MKRDGPESNRTNLTARQERVATCLAAGKSVAAACRECGVGKSTVWTWLKQPAFRERVAQLQKQVLDTAVARLSSLVAGKVLDMVERMLESESESRQLESGEKAVDWLLRITGHLDLKQEVAAIKEKLSQR